MITPAGYTSGNYTINYQSGTLRINPAAPPPQVTVPAVLPLNPNNPAPLTLPILSFVDTAPVISTDIASGMPLTMASSLASTQPASLDSNPVDPSTDSSNGFSGTPLAMSLALTGSVVESKATAGSVSADGISVALVREASATGDGFISVLVPKDKVAGVGGFRFLLPSSVADAAAKSKVPLRVTTTGGAPLPSWLRYVPDTNIFIANEVPDGALPIEVLIEIGKRRWTMVISQRTNPSAN
jgi:hypothetical protein